MTNLEAHASDFVTEPVAGILIREGAQTDIPFLFATWLRSYKHYSAFAAQIRADVYYHHHTRIVQRILDQHAVRVAHPEGDENTILGYVVDRPGVLHFVYVKGAFRRMGVATRLLGNYVTYTHRTPAVDYLLPKHPEWVYNPYLI